MIRTPFSAPPRPARLPVRRRWRWLAMILTVLTLAATPVLPQDESEDVGILAGMLQDVLSDAGRDVRIRGFQGALSSRATVDEISIADDQGVWLTLTDVVIDWNRSALFNRRVEVNELSAGRLELARLPVTAPSDGPAMPSPTARPDFALPELPVSVNIGEVRADVVVLGAPILGEAAEFTLTGSAQLEDGQGVASFDARRTDGVAGQFVFAGAFDNESRVLQLNLDLSEGEGGIATTLLSIPGEPALSLSIAGEGPINTFEADIALATDGAERVTGQFSFIDESPETGLLSGGGFSLEIAGDLRPLLSSDLHPFFGDQASLRATGQRDDQGEITLPELSISTGAMQVDGSAAISPQGLPRRVQLVAGIMRDDGEPTVLPGSGGAVMLQSATLNIGFDEEVSRDWSLSAEVDTLDLTQATLGSTTLSGRGRLGTSVVGDGSPLFEGVFEFAAQEIEARDPDVQRALGDQFLGLISVSLTSAGDPLELTGLTFEGDTVSLTAYGSLEGLTFTGFTELEAPNLSVFSGLAQRPLGGHALATVDGSVNALTGAFDLGAELTTTDLSVGIAEADALLAGQAGIQLSIRRDTEGTTLRNLDVRAGTLQLSAEGSLEPSAADIAARLVASDLSRLGPGYGGQARLDATLTTTEIATRLQLDGSVIDLALADLPAADVIGGIFTGSNTLRADLSLIDGVTRVSELTLTGPRLDLQAEGSYSAERPDLTLTLNRLDMAALRPGGRGQITGRAEMNGENGTTRFGLFVDGQGPIVTGIDQLDALVGRGLRLEARATTTPDGGVRIDTARLDADGVRASVTGSQEPSGAARFSVDAALQNIGRLAPGLAGNLTLAGDVTRAAGDTGYGVDLRASGPQGMSATARGRVNEDFTMAVQLDGQVQSQLLNAMLEPASVSGLIRFNGSLTGAPGIDALRMDVSLSDGRYALPAAGIAFADIDAQAQLDGLSAQVQLEGRSLAGGTGTVSGRIRLDQGADADLSVQVRNLVVQQANLFDARVSGTVRLLGQIGRNALVSGDVTLDEAEIRIPNSPLGRAGFGLQNLSHVGEGAGSLRTRVNAGIATGTRVGSAPVPLRLDLRINAPSSVFVRGRGLDAELAGTLRLGGTTRAVVPAGDFTLVRGRLDLLGNRFTLTDGSASMIGSFMPFITLIATTESDGVVTSITVTGEANSPEIEFSSVPDLPDDEILARLIFGRALTSLSPFQAAQLALSVATLTGRADNSIISRTRETLGLDDLDFTVNDEGTTELRAGRRISDQLYTDVTVDAAGESEVSINLDLTDSITLRGSADSEGGSSVGIFFARDY